MAQLLSAVRLGDPVAFGSATHGLWSYLCSLLVVLLSFVPVLTGPNLGGPGRVTKLLYACLAMELLFAPK